MPVSSYEVEARDSFVTLLVNGWDVVVIPFPWDKDFDSVSFEKETSVVVCLHTDFPLTINCGCDSKHVQSGSVISYFFQKGGELELKRQRKWEKAYPQVQNIAAIFNDPLVNPAFGALKALDLIQEVVKRNGKHAMRDLLAFFVCKPTMCHFYIGKDNAVWVVLHSHCKKYQPTGDTTSFVELLKVLQTETTEKISLSRLFHRVTGFEQTLASNFTVLKKFLIKYNETFVWFQSEDSKTTKITLQSQNRIKSC
jgi:hypothetical protein